MHSVIHSASDLAQSSGSVLHSVIHSASGLVQGSDSVSDLGLASRSDSDLAQSLDSVLHSAIHSASGLAQGSGSVLHSVIHSASGLAQSSGSVLHSVIHSASGLGLASRLVSDLGLVSRSVSVLGLASRSVIHSASDLAQSSDSVSGLDSVSRSASGSASHSGLDLGLASRSASHQRRFHSISQLRCFQALPLLPDLPDRLPLPYAADTVLLQHLPDLHCNPVLPHYSYNPPDCLRMCHIHHSGLQQGLPAMYNGLPVPVLHHLIRMQHGDADILPHSHYSRLQNNVSLCYSQADISSVRLPSYCNCRLSWITSGLPDHRSAP